MLVSLQASCVYVVYHIAMVVVMLVFVFVCCLFGCFFLFSHTDDYVLAVIL